MRIRAVSLVAGGWALWSILGAPRRRAGAIDSNRPWTATDDDLSPPWAKMIVKDS